MNKSNPIRVINIELAYWWVLHGKEYHRTLGHTNQEAIRKLIHERRKEKELSHE